MATVIGTAAADTVRLGFASSGVAGRVTLLADTISGRLGNDDLSGDDGDDLIWGEEQGSLGGSLGGSDRLFGGRGNDTMVGDTGHMDSGTGGNDHLSGEDGNDRIFGDVGDAGGADGVLLFATGGDDTISGGIGDDRLHGDALRFQLRAQGGRDTIDGGAGNDIVYGDAYGMIEGNRSGGDTLSGGEGNDIVYGDAAYLNHTPRMAGDVIDGGAGDDTLAGDAGRDVPTRFSDFISRSGNDRINGGEGNDRIAGDLLSYVPEGAPGGPASVASWGIMGSDELMGDAGIDYIVGDSYLLGQGAVCGHDRILGGDGNDIILGDGLVDSGVTTLSYGSDKLFGGAGNDFIWGDAPAGAPLGSAADFIDGGTGNDTMHGGGGRDWFIFGPEIGGTGIDRITDFLASKGSLAAEDLLDLRGLGLGFTSLDGNLDGRIDDADTHAALVGGNLVLDLGAAAGGAAGISTVRLDAVLSLQADNFA